MNFFWSDPMPRLVERTVRVRVVTPPDNSILFGVSDDMPRLMLVAETEEQMAERIPGAIRELLEAEGCHVERVEVVDNSDLASVPLILTTNAVFEEAA